MSNKRALAKELAKEIADKALVGVSSGADGMIWGASEEKVADKVVKQNPLLKSKRFYSLLAGGIALSAGVFGADLDVVKVEELVSLVGSAAAALWVAWDKFSDIREERA